jgi:hypothetical protein
MRTPTEYFLWWVDDDGTGKPRRTTYKLTRADAARATLEAGRPKKRSARSGD